MSHIYICGSGAVSPAGWGVASLISAVEKGEAIPAKEISRPNSDPMKFRPVSPPTIKPNFLSHPRFRRSSAIAQYSIGAALEALGEDIELVRTGKIRLGLVWTAMSGCVNYSRRFYDETLRDPGTASPLVFPETVFNAPASHIASFLSSTAVSYTLVGDPGTFLQGLVLAAQWLEEDRIDACLVVGGEEGDWLTSNAFRLFVRSMILSDGAGALYLKRTPRTDAAIKLSGITDSFLFTRRQSRACAVEKMWASLPQDRDGMLLCDGLQGNARMDRAEKMVTARWPGDRVSPKVVLGDGLMAATAWQCIVATEYVKSGRATSACVPVVGCNQQAIGAWFEQAST